MPLVKVEITQGKSQGYKSAILDGIHEALVTAFKIPADDINQRLYELPGKNFEKRNTKSSNFTIIEITVFKGRSYEAKELLYAEIVKNLSRNPGIEGDDILIVLNEQPLENWAVSGGKPADKVDLGFKINV
jgi:phenylpyruvate tautomerase PptA (4-oxalocrotonate tautomerase family)